MSADAERYAQTCPHPKVKGGTLRLFEVIARAIPEGHTTTPPMRMEDLARDARQHERTARRNRDVLAAIHEIRILDGGQGNAWARYELLHLDGTRPAEAVPLPLRADLREAPRTKRGRTTSGDTPDLFDPTSGVLPEVRAYTVGRFVRCWLSWVVNIGRFARRWWPTSGVLPDVGPSVYSATTTYVRSEKDPDAVENLVVVAARAREPADEFLDWFERTYPRFHHGAAYLVHRARDSDLVRTLLARPRTDVAHLQAMTVLLWSLTSDGVIGSNAWWIATQVTVRDVFILHRKADFLDVEVRRRQQTPVESAATRVPCRGNHEPPCARDYLCIERLVAEGQAARQEKSG